MERVGNKLARVLFSADLWGDMACGRPACLPCGKIGGNWDGKDEGHTGDDGVAAPTPAPVPAPNASTRGPRCWTESVLYVLECLPCLAAGWRATYVGETGRSANERGGEHDRDARLVKESSAIVKHRWNRHGLPGWQVLEF